MMKYLRIVAVLFVAVGVAMCVRAQEPAGQAQGAAVIPADQQPTSQQLDRLFDVMRVKEQMATMTKTMSGVVQQTMVQQLNDMQKDHPELGNMTPAQKEAAAKVVSKFMEQAIAAYGSDEIIADMKVIYQRHLTGNDVENLITFYGSSSGQHMLDMVPVIMQEFMPTAMEKMQSKMRPLMVEMSKEMEDIVRTPGSADKPAAKPDQQK